MIDHQTNKEMILIEEVSDEAVEAAGLAALGGFPTLPHTYCFACLADPPSATSSVNHNLVWLTNILQS